MFDCDILIEGTSHVFATVKYHVFPQVGWEISVNGEMYLVKRIRLHESDMNGFGDNPDIFVAKLS